jgi:hypothetical protein
LRKEKEAMELPLAKLQQEVRSMKTEITDKKSEIELVNER